MKNLILRSFLLLVILGLGAFLLSPAQAQVVQAQGTVIYNIYATDGYFEMADGVAVYGYGFIGGGTRVGDTLTYQTSYCTGDGITRNCVMPSAVPTGGQVPAPTGGQWNGMDSLLAGNAQFPAPLIYAAIGDIVEIRLKNLGVKANPNAPNDPHSIHLHGMDVDAANDGVPETSVGAVPANLCADGTYYASGLCPGGYAPGAGNVIVYMFTPKKVGTYMYHCHQEADIHVNMGMYGALVVYNATDPAYLNGGPGKGFGGDFNGFKYDKDYIMLVSDMDTRGHADEEGTYEVGGIEEPDAWDPNPYRWSLYQPQYWFINGLSFPQTIHAAFPSLYTYADWIATHPGYETLYTGSVSIPNAAWGTLGQKVLLRVINMGFETQPLHMHGYHGKIIGSDQRVWDWANRPGTAGGKNAKPPTPFGLGLEKNTLTIGSGETYEWLVDFGQQAFQSTYQPGVESCYDPFTNQPVANAAGCPPIPQNGDPLTGNFYIGGPTVTGLEGPTPNYDAAGFGSSQYFPFHNHDDYKATNDGSYPGGMFTMLVPTP